MLPRLQAEEQLAAISAAALGSGNVKRDDARRETARLRKMVGGGRRGPAVRPTPQMLAAVGVAVQLVPPPAASSAPADAVAGAVAAGDDGGTDG